MLVDLGGAENEQRDGGRDVAADRNAPIVEGTGRLLAEGPLDQARAVAESFPPAKAGSSKSNNWNSICWVQANGQNFTARIHAVGTTRVRGQRRSSPRNQGAHFDPRVRRRRTDDAARSVAKVMALRAARDSIIETQGVRRGCRSCSRRAGQSRRHRLSGSREYASTTPGLAYSGQNRSIGRPCGPFVRV